MHPHKGNNKTSTGKNATRVRNRNCAQNHLWTFYGRDHCRHGRVRLEGLRGRGAAETDRGEAHRRRGAQRGGDCCKADDKRLRSTSSRPRPRAVCTIPITTRSPTIAEEGHKNYLSAGCNGCHGGGGGGGMCPPLTNDTWVYGPDDDTLFRLVALGSDELKKQGYHRVKQEVVVGPMPPFGGILKTSDSFGRSSLSSARSIRARRRSRRCNSVLPAAAASALIFGKPPSLSGLAASIVSVCGDANAGIKITAPWQAIY